MTSTPRVALVTGGSSGVGRAAALGLGAAGHAVAILARTEATLAEARSELEGRGVTVMACQADVRDSDAVSRAVAAVESELGPITLVVNSAGTALGIGPMWEVDPRDWWTDVETSMRGAFTMCRAVIPRMMARREGRILNVSSYAGLRPAPYTSGYGVAKAGLASLTESLAVSLEPYGIRAFTVTPGFVPTPLTQRFVESPEGRRWLPELQGREALGPELFVQLVVTIARGDADRLNGLFLHALDDLDELLQRHEEIESHDLYAPRLRRFGKS